MSVEDHEVISEELTSASESQAEFELVIRVSLKATHNMKNPHSTTYFGDGEPWYSEGVSFTQTHENDISVTVTLDFAEEKDGVPPEIDVSIDESFIKLETDFDAEDVEVVDRWSLED